MVLVDCRPWPGYRCLPIWDLSCLVWMDRKPCEALGCERGDGRASFCLI